MTRAKYCYFNEKIRPENKTHINPRDIGILRGYGVFEFLRTYGGEPFLLNEHFARLKQSAKTLRIKLPVTKQKLRKLIKKLLVKNKMAEAGIRIILTGGNINQDGITYDYNSPTFFILTEKPHQYPVSFYNKGVALITFEHQREIPQSKTIDYLMAVQLQRSRQRKKALEILYTKNGAALECATSNFFIFKDNKLITPKNNVLIGTTRNFVIKFARPYFKIEERDIQLEEVKFAAETFITATTKEIMPVVKIDNQMVGNGKVGENTKYLMKLFRKFVNQKHKIIKI